MGRDITILIGAKAGQGIQTIDSILAEICHLPNFAKTESAALDLGHEHESFLVQDTNLYQHETYQRYKLTDTGVSPRCVPCTPHGLVRVAGNEHTPDGLPSEDPDNRNAMVEKRFKKLFAMKKEMALPSVFCADSKVFLTGWGSSKGSIMEACLQLREEGIDAGWIIFEDIWPMDALKLTGLLNHKKLIMVEGNATCQLGTLIRSLTGIDYISSVLKYDGRPIFPEFIIEKVKQIVGP